jgi:hypothetical protein
VAEPGAGVFGGEVPLDLALAGVDGVLPDGQLSVEEAGVVDSPVQALPGQGAELDLGDVEPGAVFGGVVELQALGQRESFPGLEGLIP